jgi:PEP-CTERM motif-containing protein
MRNLKENTMLRRTLAAATGLVIVLVGVTANAAETGNYVGMDDDYWGASIGQVDNTLAPGPAPAFGYFDGAIDATTVNAWLAGEEDFYGISLIAQPASYYGNGPLPVVGTETGWKHMTLTFDDWTTAEVELVEAAFIKRGIPQGSLRDAYYDDMNFNDHESTRAFPANGAPRPVLYQADLSAHMGKTVVLDADVSLHAIDWSESDKYFDIYALHEDYDYTTVTYNSLVFDGNMPPLPPEEFSILCSKDTVIVDGGTTPWENDTGDEVGPGLDGTFDFWPEAETSPVPVTNQTAIGMLGFDFSGSGAEGMQAVGDGTLTVNFNECTEYPPDSGVTNPVSWYELLGESDWDETTVTGMSYAQDGDVSNALGDHCDTMAPAAWGNFVPVEFTIPEATITKLLNGEIAGLAITNADGDEWSNRMFTKDAHWTLNATPTLTFSAAPAPDLPGDANGDGAVTDADYTIWADNYGQCGVTSAEGDFNGDGCVTDADYTIWADNYGLTASSVPEPTTMGLIALGSLLALRRRK